MGSREEKIRRIITMEDRVSQCRRCKSLLRCIRKPSLGKGDLEPDLIIVFEAESYFTKDLSRVIELRDMVKEEFNLTKIYHSYMVRCQPKACVWCDNTTWYGEARLLGKEHNCILSGRACDGIPIKPGNEEIISCLPFLLEEIEILSPDYVILMGERVADFVLKAYGILEDINLNNSYIVNDMTFLTTENEELFTKEKCVELAGFINK